LEHICDTLIDRPITQRNTGFHDRRIARFPYTMGVLKIHIYIIHYIPNHLSIFIDRYSK